MRIGIFSDYTLPHIGGVETSIFHQHRALTRAGHQVVVISPPMKGADKLSDKHEEFMRLKSVVQLSFDGMGIYVYQPGIYKKLDSLKLDIVHVQTEFNTSSLGIRYARSRSLPLLYTAHTFIVPQIELLMRYPRLMAVMARAGQRMLLSRYSPQVTFKPKHNLLGIPCSTYAEKSILTTWMRLASIPDAIIAPSQRMADYVGYYVKDTPITCIPNPFASSLTDRGDVVVRPVSEKVRFLTSAMLRPEKRLHMLIEAVALLSEKERRRISLDMFGGGIEHARLSSLVERYSLQDVVRLHGALDNRVVQDAMLQNDIVISASFGFDNQPMAILEALHAGNAIMLCDQYLKEGTDSGNSILVKPSAAGFAEGFRYALNHQDEVSKMKQASKALAERFSYATFAQKYEQVLASLT